MSGLEALALACSIFQVITFARDTITVAKAVHQNGSLNKSVSENAEDLVGVVIAMNVAANLPARSPEYQQLFDISRKCETTAKTLIDETSRITASKSPGSWRATAKTTVRMWYKGDKLRSIEEQLAKIEKTLQTGLLERTL